MRHGMPCEWHPVFTGCFSFSELIGGKEDWREYAGQICSRRGESEHQQFRSRNDYEKYACADSEVNSWPDWNMKMDCRRKHIFPL